MSSLYLSRATLNRDASTNTLAALLDPNDVNTTLDAHHKLLWSLFADSSDRKRDFLWRADSGGKFMLLSQRLPVDQHNLFDLNSREFAPSLVSGDRLTFSLRVNAVVSRWAEGASGKKKVRHDIVMDALHNNAETETTDLFPIRADSRDEKTQTAARDWMDKQGDRCGFEPEHVLAQSYSTQRVPRRGASDARFGVLDLEGHMIVKDSKQLLASIAQGFGKAKAFGNGLMLIKRY